MKFLFIILFLFSSGERNFDIQLKEYLAEKLSGYKNFEYEISQMPKNFMKIEIDNDKEFRVSKNYAYVPVKVFYSEDNTSNSVVSVKVKLYREVLITTKKINKNEILTENLVSKKIQDVSLLNGSIATASCLNTYRAKSTIKKESVLLSELIEKIPIVNKGDKVYMHSGKNGVDITIETICRQDGCTGDVIAVQSKGKIYKAKVIDNFNLALVE